MVITTRVKTSARVDSISLDETTNCYLISVKERPIEGEANKAIIQLLSNKFDVPKTSISLISGQKSKIKRFRLDSF